MSDVNQFTCTAVVCFDPEIRFTQTGVAVCTLRVAIGQDKKVGDKWERGEAVFIDVQCWDFIAKRCEERVRKGSMVSVYGKLQLDQWDDKQSGQKRQKHFVRADRIEVVDRGEAKQQGETSREYATVDGGHGGDADIPF